MKNEQTEEKLKKTVKGMFWNLLDALKYMAITGIIVFVLTRFFIPVVVIPTESMEPEIPAGSFVICSKISYMGSKTPQRGDAIIFRRGDETSDSKIYAKRVVGLPGETIVIKDGTTYIDGKIYTEDWLFEQPRELDFGPFVVPEGKYFCMGDNRNNSFDSRYWTEHFISEENIIAKAHFVISPQKLGVINDMHQQ